MAAATTAAALSGHRRGGSRRGGGGCHGGGKDFGSSAARKKKFKIFTTNLENEKHAKKHRKIDKKLRFWRSYEKTDVTIKFYAKN